MSCSLTLVVEVSSFPCGVSGCQPNHRGFFALSSSHHNRPLETSSRTRS